MRSSNQSPLRSAVVVCVMAAISIACGSEASSQFNTPPDVPLDGGGGSSGGSSGGFVETPKDDAGPAPNPSCKKLTCADQGIECGPAGDGCGGLIPDCGKCGAGLRCGGPNAPSKCVSPSVGTGCVPKTCAELGIQCGLAGDGCGGTLTCPSCQPGEQCGVTGKPSQCVAATPTGPDGGGACIPKTCDDYKLENKDCGKQSDGCGNIIDCGSCVDPQFCGGGGPSKCAVSGGGVCVPKTCADYPGKCGAQSDGCGGLTISCGTCTLPEICGGGGTPSVCGGGSLQGPDGGACAPKTPAQCGTTECGKVADGCGGVVDCGTSKCTNGTICGGAGVANQCGTPACTPIKTCPAGLNCGQIGDGCGGLVTCGGTCPAPQICGGGGKPNVCGGGTVTGPGGGSCVPLTQAQACATPKSCGPVADGCGGVVQCGNCTSPEVCGGGGTPSVCGGGNQCTPKTKAAACGTMSCGYAADGCGGSYKCGVNDTPDCPTGQSCGLYAPNQCGSLSGPCINDTTTACTDNSDCCSGFCGVNQKCQPSACTSDGVACTTNAQCCSGKCAGTCQSLNGGACKGANNSCTTNGECCSKLCTNGKCDPGSSFCRQNNDTCVSSDQCCSGRCNIANGALAGTCQDLSISGIGSCYVAGTVVSCTGQNASGYACNQDCCSKSCGTSGAAAGTTICEQPSGCAPQGELCQTDQDCCGYLLTDGLKCSKMKDTDPFGRCSGNNSCKKPGMVCKTGSSSTACSVANNCCEPLNMPPGNCSSNPDLCCRQDSLGIPRCIRDYICVPAGGVCSTSADCCNQKPCVDDGTGTNTFRCSANTCVADGGNCSINADCCGGNCYKQAPGDQTGQCKVPTCTKKTCADYPANTCGQQSDGCGGLTANCGTCTYPQTCGGGGTPNVCGGQLCSPKTCTDLGAECGTIPDGCGNILTCPNCPAGKTCGGGGVANKCGTPTCAALTCTAQGIECGQTGDGCGNVLTCPPCPSGTTCGGGGVANKCGAPACTPLQTCPAGKNCGDYPDGCGGSIHCGECGPGETCGGGGSPNVCGAASCSPKSCTDQGAECGKISDQCGGVLTCPQCASDQYCNSQNLCVGLTCQAKTCDQQGIECGPTADGCGNLLDCGTCPAGSGCGAGGVPGKCGKLDCTPLTCAQLGAVCGQVADGCGGLTPDCGTCAGNLSCKNGACVQACTPTTCAAAGANCGSIADGCGGIIDCGVCPDGYQCGYGGKANVCGAFQPK